MLQKLKISLIILVIGYITFYFGATIIAMLNGGTSTINSLLTGTYEDQYLRDHTLRSFRKLYIVATREVEDCDKNPREYYPNGYKEIGGAEFSYPRGGLFAFDTYTIFSLGLPQRHVVNGVDCLPNSQGLSESDLNGKWIASKLAEISSKNIEESDTGGFNRETKTYEYLSDTLEVSLQFKEKRLQLFIDECELLSGGFVIKGEQLLFNQETRQECETKVSETADLLRETFDSQPKISLSPGKVIFSSATETEDSSQEVLLHFNQY